MSRGPQAQRRVFPRKVPLKTQMSGGHTEDDGAPPTDYLHTRRFLVWHDLAPPPPGPRLCEVSIVSVRTPGRLLSGSAVSPLFQGKRQGYIDIGITV